MKKAMLNIMAATGITLVVLAVVALGYSASFLCIGTVFQALGLNTVIYVGISFLSRPEYHYPIVETALKLSYIIALALLSGRIFGWYSSLSAPVLALMSIVIFGVCVYLDAMNLSSEVKEINGLIEKQTQKETESE